MVENLQGKESTLNATIGYAMGLPLSDVQYSPSGRPFKVAHDGEPVMDVLSV